MGGFGSGGWNAKGRATTADAKPLDVNYLRRIGALTLGSARSVSWTRAGESMGNILVRCTDAGLVLDYRWRSHGGEWHPVEERVGLLWLPCRFGGERPFLICPKCDEPVLKLYGLARFLCRSCNRLSYVSQRERAADRASRRADKIRARLGCEPGWGKFPSRPKGMWRRTYERLLERIDQSEAVIDDHAMRLIMRLERNPGGRKRGKGMGGFWR